MKETDIDKSTSFRWRHRLLQAREYSKDQYLVEIAEVDKTFILESHKDERWLSHKARKRAARRKSRGAKTNQYLIKYFARNAS
ncbi:MAG: hypothetical protein GY927_06415 [bacterium]|nr:hypothetical protein [bacterium]